MPFHTLVLVLVPVFEELYRVEVIFEIVKAKGTFS